jgi:hypothetical protein
LAIWASKKLARLSNIGPVPLPSLPSREKWLVGADQVRYSDDGHWYAKLARFPAALFDAHGYFLFASEEEYRTSPHISIGKHISVPQPGISAIPGYVRFPDVDASPSLDGASWGQTDLELSP